MRNIITENLRFFFGYGYQQKVKQVSKIKII